MRTPTAGRAGPPPDVPDPEAPFRGSVRCQGYERISHGLFHQVQEGLTPEQAFVRDLRAWLLVLPESARFTHLTGARLRGWTTPKLPEGLPVFAAVRGTSRRPRRPGLLCSRLVPAPAEPHRVHGLPVDDSEEILLRAARDLGELDLRVLVEGALRCHDLDAESMDVLLASRRPGVRKLRTAYLAASAKTQSGPETVLLAFHEAMQIAVEPQKLLHNNRGDVVAQADLWVVGTDFFHEYDGEVHRDRQQHATDLRRERGLAGTPYVRKGFTLDDLLNHALVVMHELDRDLGRAHDPRRFRTWQRLVEQSLYSEVGRERLLNRWHREMGVVEWSRSA